MRRNADVPSDNGKAISNVTHQLKQQILDALNDIRYGSVQVIVCDGNVVEIETRKKQRLAGDNPGRAAA